MQFGGAGPGPWARKGLTREGFAAGDGFGAGGCSGGSLGLSFFWGRVLEARLARVQRKSHREGSAWSRKEVQKPQDLELLGFRGSNLLAAPAFGIWTTCSE